MDTMKLAVPTMGKAWLKSKRSGHFGRCDCFTIVEMREGDILAIEELDNPSHEENGCHRPVMLLQDAGVDAIVSAGMGSRPMDGFAKAGIAVYFDAEAETVGDVVNRVANGDVALMTSENACHH